MMRPCLWIALIGVASCQSPSALEDLQKSELQSAPIPALTPDRRVEIADALRARGTPYQILPHGDAWRSSDVEVETQYGIELSAKDIDEIIALARQSGVAKPRKLWAGNTLGGGGRLTRVMISGEPAFDPVARVQKTHFLRVVCPQWKALDGDRFPTIGGGPWQLDIEEGNGEIPLWTEESRYFREGACLWTYRASDAIPETVVLDVFSALASSSLRWPPSDRDLPRFEMNRHLGRILTRSEVLDQAAFLVESWISEDWEYFVQVSLGRWAAASFALHRDEEGWIVVGVRFAQA
jgi:hypothetical protein